MFVLFNTKKHNIAYNLSNHSVIITPDQVQIIYRYLPPLTTEDQVPPEELLREEEEIKVSPGEPWDKNSAPGGPVPRLEDTLCALGVRWDLGDILGGPVKQNLT